jgi:acetyl esterase/lipase
MIRADLGTEKRMKMTNSFLCSPIVAESHTDLAPASIHVAEIDTLYSEGIAYHHKLMKAGTKSKLKIYEGVGHPFANWNGELSAGKEFVEDSIRALKEAYGLDES